MTSPSDQTERPTGGTSAARRRRALAAAGVAVLFLAAGCGEDAVTDGQAPSSDDEPPQDPQPQDNEQRAPDAEDPDLSGDEEPKLTEGDEEDREERD